MAKPSLTKAAAAASVENPKANTDIVPAASAGAPAVTGDPFDAHAGAGLENVTGRDLLIPRLTILQALSPQVQPKKPEYIDGATVGQFCDVSLGVLFDEAIFFLPVHYAKQWMEWAPRASGKRLVTIHDTDAILEHCVYNDKKQPMHGENSIQETAQFFGLNLSANAQRCFFPLKSTQLKYSKRWLNLSTQERVKRADGSEYVPPFFYRVYKLSVAEDSNNQGDWYSLHVDRDKTLQEFAPVTWRALFEQCLEFRNDLLKGKARADLSKEEDSEENEAL